MQMYCNFSTYKKIVLVNFVKTISMQIRKYVGNLFATKAKEDNFYKYEKINPTWLNMGKSAALLNAYENIPELNAIINYGANSLSSGVWKYLNEDGEEEPDNEILKIVNYPNAVQNGNEFLKNYYVFRSVFGNAFIYRLYPDGFKPLTENIKALWLLPSQQMKINYTGKLFQQTKIEDIVKNYTFGNDNIPFETADILLKNEIGIKYINGQYVLGQSKIFGLSKALSNIVAAYESRNVLMNSRGAIGAWVNASKDGTGRTYSLTTDEKDTIEKDFNNKFGLTGGRSSVMVTNKDLRWEGNSFDNKKLQLLEETEQCFYKICDAFSTPKEVFSNTKGTTYLNKDVAEKSFFVNNIIPIANDLANSLNLFLNIGKGRLKLDFSHLAILQEDEKIKSEKNFKNSQIILNIQKSVVDKNTSKEAAIKLVKYLFEISEEQAKLILF